MREQEVCVLHVAGMGDQAAFETLCHTTQVIASLGLTQVLVALDEVRGAEMNFGAALVAEVRPLRCLGISVVGKIKALQLEFFKISRERTLYAVHLHGMGPCLLGSRALKGSLLRGRVLYSPHLTHAGSPRAAALLSRLVQRYLKPLDCAAVAASLTEADMLSKLFNRSAEVLPHRVSGLFFEAPRQESTRPSVLADGFGDEAVDLVSRLSVLLNGRDARVPISWLGIAEGAAQAQLEAASVPVLAIRDDAEKAQWLSRASAFIHISSGNRLPLAAVQAMAAGVPCLVSDTPAHRALIRHGETGFICTSERDFVEKLILLLRDRAERTRIGEAARGEAERCFTLRNFDRAILRAYGFFGSKAFQTRLIARPLPSAMRLTQ